MIAGSLALRLDRSPAVLARRRLGNNVQNQHQKRYNCGEKKNVAAGTHLASRHFMGCALLLSRRLAVIRKIATFETLRPAFYPFAFLISSISGGTMSNKF